MEANLASTLCSGLWTHSTHECFFPPDYQPRHNFQFCARACKSTGGVTEYQDRCKSKPRITLQHRLSPASSVSPLSPGRADLYEELVTMEISSPSPQADETDISRSWLFVNEKPEPGEEGPLTLAECSRLVSAYIEHPEWQNFLDSGRYATTHTTEVNTRWNELKLDTVCPADKDTPFPALTPVTLDRLVQLSPSISRLHSQLQAGKDPLADKDDLKAFIKKARQNNNELFAGGNHSLVIKWRKGPGYVLKIARSQQDSIRLTREQNLYLWLRNPDNILLNLTTTPLRAAFSVSGKPILALRQVDSTARDRLLSMREHHSLNERLNFALSVIFHFCQMYHRFLEKDVLLADRHDDNIGFNEIPLQGRNSTSLDEAVLQVPVMLDLDPYWFGDQELRTMQLFLPTWVPVMVGLLEEVFTPRSSCSQISQSRVKVIDQLRQLASPVFTHLSSAALVETQKTDRESAIQSCINHWFQGTSPESSELPVEARSHIEPLLTSLNQWDSAPRTVAQWNKRLQESIGELLLWLNNWKNETELPLLKDSNYGGIIKVQGAQGETFSRDQQILTLLSMIHGKLGCQKCSRTFTTNTEFRRHWQLHQQNRLRHCKVCDGDFTRIIKHERVHTGEKPYKCKHCSKGFSQKDNLRNHLRTHSGDKPYKCEHCGKSFSLPGTLKSHLRTHSGDKPYKCEQCGKSYSNVSTLKNHLSSHSGDNPYKCERCGKTFANNGNLQRHLRAYSGGKPYKCEHCGWTFSQKSNLQSHLRSHSGDKPCKCEHCGRCFSRSSSLKLHLRTHSGDKPYKCEQCGKCFSQSYGLRRHLRLHPGTGSLKG